MGYRRRTIVFALPLDIVSGHPGYFLDNLGGSAKAATDDEWAYIQMYINPQQFNVSDKKLINTQMTKGGYAMQYWGEELSTIQISGTTGSGGIEAINILRSVYRHEQKQFENILKKRMEQLKDSATEAAMGIASDLKSDYSGDGGGFLAGAADLFTGGLYSNLVNGFETLGDVLTGSFSLPARKKYSNFSTTPSLAYLASSVVIYYGGERYRGFFTNFSVTESAQSPGLFDYNTSFTILQRTGVRNNFMPWHRNPLDVTGKPKKSKSTTSSSETSPKGLSVPYISESNSSSSSQGSSSDHLSAGEDSSEFSDAGDRSEEDGRSRPTSRRRQ